MADDVTGPNMTGWGMWYDGSADHVLTRPVSRWRRARWIGVVALVALIAGALGPEARAGVGLVRSVVVQTLDELGVTSGGVYTEPTGVSGLGSTDNAIVRADGTGGETAQGSSVTVSDTGVFARTGNLELAPTTNLNVSIGSSSSVVEVYSGDSTGDVHVYDMDEVRLGSGVAVGWSSTSDSYDDLDAGLARSEDRGQAVMHLIDGTTGNTTRGYGVFGGVVLGSTAPVSSLTYGQVTWDAGLGAITHVQGPSDQVLALKSSANRGLELEAPSSSIVMLSGVASRSQLRLESGSPLMYQTSVGGNGQVQYTDYGDVTTSDGVSSDVFVVTLSAGFVTSGQIRVMLVANDGTDYQVRYQRLRYLAHNVGGTITATVTVDEEEALVTSGTLTGTWAAADNTDGTFDLRCTPDSSLTPTTSTIYAVADQLGTWTVAAQ